MLFNRRTLATSIIALPLLKAAQASAETASDMQMAPAADRLSGLTRYFPGGDLDGTALDLLWIDPERQLFHIARGEEDDARLNAFVQSQFGTAPQSLVSLSKIEDLVGFGLLNIRQMASFNPPPNTMQVVRLDSSLDEVDLAAIWEAAGYEKRQNDWGEFWTIGEDAELDLTNPIQQAVMSSMNNIAMIDDRVIGFAPKAFLLSQMMATDAGATPTVNDAIAPIVEFLPETAIGTWLFDGSLLEFQVPENVPEAQGARFERMLDESDDAVSPMPQIRTASVGTTEGAAIDPDLHSNSATAYAVLEVESEVAIAAEVIRWRHENMASLVSAQPLSEILGEIEIEVVSDTVLRVSSRDAASRATFNQMVMMADTILFAYRPSQVIY